ncbi:spore coat SP96 precursor [Fusarium beomiforme]|uniref:Spore coat SP96 n=1 Tax=Fusarium beomiforme TaxID=44412 RepID=A0A9P5DXW7_9HYPO|nr:spore coat SP96 precursor [Fusarium beomiforme]
MPSLLSSLSILALAATQASSHVIMVEPHPFNLDTEPLYQTWPLSEELPFPCQGRTQHAEQVTKVTAGETQLVKFWGSAVHGGGSCQFSVAYGKEPPKDPKKWHTIYSIIGGCPAEAEGNIPSTGTDPHGRENGAECGNDTGKECTKQFNIPIPKDMQNGPATFAWTWFNKIGNREMYMVCSPTEVVGGKDDSSYVDTLPAIFRANIPGECTTGASVSVINFPEPGDFGKIYEQATPNSEGTCAKGIEPDFKDVAGAPAPGKPSESDSPSGQPAPSQPSAPTPAPEQPSVPASSSAPIQPSAPAAPVAPSAPAGPSPVQPSSLVTMPSSPAQPSEAPAPVDSAKPGTGTPAWSGEFQACPSDVQPGMMHCFSETTWGICNQGWAFVSKVAAGTKCKDGLITAE